MWTPTRQRRPGCETGDFAPEVRADAEPCLLRRPSPRPAAYDGNCLSPHGSSVLMPRRMSASSSRGIASASSSSCSSGCLLLADEVAVPEEVQNAECFFLDLGLWYQLSRNEVAHGCEDAARKRRRGGQEGIPLRDELKSYCGRVTGGPNDSVVVLAHCRADRMLDFGKLSDALAAHSVHRLPRDALAAIGMAYGRVNPFENWVAHCRAAGTPAPPVVQVFDAGLVRPAGGARTVMTNAGDRTWAVELYAAQLCWRLGAMWTDIAAAPSARVRWAQSGPPRDPG